jgi:putative transposase
MKQWYTAKEIAQVLNVNHSTIARRAERESWEAQKRMGKGGGFEYHINNLPIDARRAMEAQEIAELLPSSAEQVKGICAEAHYTDRQREAADARATLVRSIANMQRQGVTQQAALTTLLTQAATGALSELNPVLDKALRLAKDSRGRGSSPYPSVRSLKRWLSPSKKDLAPVVHRELIIPDWAETFLKCYQRPEKPTVEHAYRQFKELWKGSETPSIHSVRRFLKRVGNVSREKGRMGQRDLKNLLPFVRRSFDQLKPADIYSADGHTFDAEVSHPLHGRPFRPEITTFIDIATRKAVGYSIDLAESSLAVLDALIDACGKALPAMIYVDNGSGYCNALLKDESVGVLARLGAEISHSLPYNSQARGVIERVHQTLWVDGAKEIAGYIGKDMDREAALMHHKLSRKAIRENGKTHLMGWEDFMAFCDSRIEFYNSKPHASLPKIHDGQRRRNMSPNEAWEHHVAEGWEVMTLSQDEAAAVFRPRVIRKVLRGEIRLMNNIYFSQALTEFHNEEVQIAYDIHDAEWIWVYELESGRAICKAQWNANQQHYMPMTVIEQARDKRADARLKRLDVKRDEIEAERRGRFAIQQDDPTFIPGLGNVSDIQSRIKAKEAADAEVIEANETSVRMPGDMSADERLATYRKYENGADVPPEHEYWFTSYPRSKEYKSLTQRYAEM